MKTILPTALCILICSVLPNCAAKPKTLQERLLAGEKLSDEELKQRAAERKLESESLAKEQQRRQQTLENLKKSLREMEPILNSGSTEAKKKP